MPDENRVPDWFYDATRLGGGLPTNEIPTHHPLANRTDLNSTPCRNIHRPHTPSTNLRPTPSTNLRSTPCSDTLNPLPPKTDLRPYFRRGLASGEETRP